MGKEDHRTKPTRHHGGRWQACPTGLPHRPDPAATLSAVCPRACLVTSPRCRNRGQNLVKVFLHWMKIRFKVQGPRPSALRIHTLKLEGKSSASMEMVIQTCRETPPHTASQSHLACGANLCFHCREVRRVYWGSQTLILLASYLGIWAHSPIAPFPAFKCN